MPARRGLQRRADRLPFSLACRFIEHEHAARVRHGNISKTGIFLSVEKSIGHLGSSVTIDLATLDHGRSQRVTGRVVRVCSVEEEHGGLSVVGVAITFSFRNENEQAAVAAFIDDLVQRDRRHTKRLTSDYVFDAQLEVADGVQRSAKVQRLALSEIVFESDFAVSFGEKIRCVVRSPDTAQAFAFTGRVFSSARSRKTADPRYLVHVRFNADPAAAKEVELADDAGPDITHE